MEVFVEEVGDEPGGDEGAADGCHFLLADADGVFVDGGGEPVRDGFPGLADAEGELGDEAVEAVEAVAVFVVVEGGAGER